MSFSSGFIKLFVVVACAGGSFGGAQGYVAASAGAAPVSLSTSDPIASKLAENPVLTGTMSPVYPTTKYTKAQLAGPAAKNAVRVARRPINKMPMQIAYIPSR
jgi:hypothetical protein